MIPSFVEIAQDARHALRSVRKDLGFFALAVSIIGLGIGACTAIFSLMGPLLIRPLPFDQPERLVWIANDGTGGLSAVTSRTSNLRDFRELNRSFEALTGYNAFFDWESTNLVGDGEPERLIGVDVAQDFLEVLGVVPRIGRNFVAEEGVWGGRRAVILSHSFWTRRYGADAAIVGTSILLNDAPHEVVGVLPGSFDFASIFAPHTRVDYLVPFPISDETDRWGNCLSMIGRLRPGATAASAQADLERVIAGLAEADPERWGLGAVVRGLQEQIARPFRSALFLLAAAAAAVMLIVCVNLSNLLLARVPKRGQEMAVRSALGAPRGRLIRLLVFESLLLAFGGALVGVVFAVATTRLVVASSAFQIPMLASVAVDGSAMLFAALTAAVAGPCVGIVPALRVAGGRESITLRDASRGASASPGGTRLLEALVIGEVALACMLLVFGGLLYQSFRQVLEVELGFQPAGLSTWKISTAREFEGLVEANAFYSQLTAQVAAVPGVEAVGLTDAVPLGRNRTWGLRAPGVEYGDADMLFAFPHLVDPHYLETMRIPLLEGRHFTAEDTGESEGVILLNETAAKAVYLGQDPLGRVVTVGGSDYRVVGIVGDVRHRSLELESGLEIYLPVAQIGAFGTLDMVVRSRLTTAALAGSVAEALHAVDSAMPADDYQSLGAIVADTVSPRRFTLLLLAAFAGTALLLAALGIYGVSSYSVTERVPEIGIRMALGESQGQVLRRVVGKTLALSGWGVVLGAAGSVLIARTLESLLYGVEPTDPQTFLAMAIVLLAVSGLAGLLPGLRASRTDPTMALRST